MPSERDLQLALFWRIGVGRDICMPNITVFCNESDFLTITKDGYVDEYEIKLSRADFNADKKKDRWEKYKYLSQWWCRSPSEAQYQWDEHPYSRIYDAPLPMSRLFPNRFWYVTPEDLITEHDVPDYAGLIQFSVISEKRLGQKKIVKKAPRLHKEKAHQVIRESIYRSGYFRFRDRWARPGWSKRD